MTNTSDFDADIDGFSFPNWGADSPEDTKAVQSDLRNYIEGQLHTILPQWSNVLASTFAYLISQAVSSFPGHCYGMAATSVLYYLNSTLKPVIKETFQMLKNESISNIKLYFLQQFFHLLNYVVRQQMESLGITSLGDQYAKILQSIQAGRPLMLLITTSRGGHAVTVFNTYNVSETLKNVVVYDNNYPGMGIVYTFDLTNGKVYSPTYNITNVLADSPSSYSTELVAKILRDFSGIIFAAFKRILTFHSPVNVTISDQLNRTISETLNEIPGATFEYSNLTDTRVFCLPLNSSYDVRLKGYEAGNCTITQFVPLANQSASSSIIEFDVNTSTSAGFELLPESANFTIHVDANGDGIAEEQKIPALDSYVEYVSVENVTVPKTYVGRGTCLPINVTMTNPSNCTVTFNVTLYGNSSTIQVRTVSLSNCTLCSFVLNWNTTDFAYGGYDIIVTADNITGETNTADNTLQGNGITLTVPGDLNGDFIVDIFDAVLLAGAFNSVSSNPNWKPNIDINDDNIVDIYDAIILAGHFNEHV
jgi:hypothetical protein